LRVITTLSNELQEGIRFVLSHNSYSPKIQSIEDIAEAAPTTAAVANIDPYFLEDSLVSALANKLVIKRSSTHWSDWEYDHIKLYRDTLARINFNSQIYGPLLPFDSLLFDIGAEEKVIVAIAESKASDKQSFFQSNHTTVEFFNNLPIRRPLPVVDVNERGCNELRIGLISYDFNDHPTTHLLEGLFLLIHELRSNYMSDKNKDNYRCNVYDNIRLHIYSYGKNDHSAYRQFLVDHADVFYELAVNSFDEINRLLVHDKISILLEMQIHTLGNRIEIISNSFYRSRFLTKPSGSSDHRDSSTVSPTLDSYLAKSYAHNQRSIAVVNYLVYPGTSGAIFFDYIYCDKTVVQVESSHRAFTERLLLLPATYQISYYDYVNNPHRQTVASINASSNFEKLVFPLLLSSISSGKETAAAKIQASELLALKLTLVYKRYLRK
jgi:hypothetical protein